MNVQPSPRILVVDGEETSRNVLVTFLKTQNFEVEEADNAEGATVKIHQFDPHIVLLDILMPGTSGSEVVEFIKEWKPETEVIMITQVTDQNTKDECFSKGAFAVLYRPVDLEDLHATIQAIQEMHKHISEPDQ